eukprot:scaffold382_cov380-Prasinococcus_capsulatus_cf.AAC.45
MAAEPGSRGGTPRAESFGLTGGADWIPRPARRANRDPPGYFSKMSSRPPPPMVGARSGSERSAPAAAHPNPRAPRPTRRPMSAAAE